MITNETESYLAAAEDIINKYVPQAEVMFSLNRQGFRIFPVVNGGNISDEEVDQFIEQCWHYDIKSLTATHSTSDIAQIRLQAREEAVERFVGGADVTYRNLESMAQLIPGLIDEIKKRGKKRKIVILGNGLSLASEEILNLFDEMNRPMVILVDLINIGKLLKDLLELKKRFAALMLPFPENYEKALMHAQQLLALIDSGKVNYLQYLVGSGNPPDLLKKASIVINTMGPDNVTKAEQQSLLATDGILLIKST